MGDWKSNQLPSSAAFRKVIELIDRSPLKICLFVNAEGVLEGIVTERDIRQAILRGISLDSPVSEIMNRSPLTGFSGEPRDQMQAKLRRRRLLHLPVVDSLGRLISLELLEDFVSFKTQDNWVVLMAGGQGTRLRPLTDTLPKPLLPVGNKPLLETILESLIHHGFKNFFISLNYKSELIESYFGDGSRWGIQIRYLKEDRKLGTAGALSLLPHRPVAPVLVMNGDLLTKLDFHHLLDFHSESMAPATMCVREYEFQVPYGVVKTENGRIQKIDEKPHQRMLVNAGIYVLEPEAVEKIPKNQEYLMTDLFEKLMREGNRPVAFPIREYWMDIGHMADFERANWEFSREFAGGIGQSFVEKA